MSAATAVPKVAKADDKSAKSPFFSKPGVSAPSKTTAVPDDDDLESLDFTGIQLEDEKDPVEATVEEAAIAFAKEDVARTEEILRDGIRSFSGVPEAEILWLMLFDLYRLMGQHDPFTAIELEYAKRFEKQPPVWKDASAQSSVSGAAVAGAILFKGDVVGANEAGFDLLLQALQKPEKIRLDVGKVKGVDADGATRLLAAFQRAKKLKKPIDLLGVDSLIKLLEPPVKSGDRNESLWQLLLDCYQRQGKQEVFDELALEFAVTFEISPPSYEAPVVAKKPVSVAKAVPRPSDDVFFLSGELRGSGRIDGFEDYLKGRERVVVDMSGVVRLDFAAAGVLISGLKPCSVTNCSVIIRHPNYLVAALLDVVGIVDVATVINAKH